MKMGEHASARDSKQQGYHCRTKPAEICQNMNATLQMNYTGEKLYGCITTLPQARDYVPVHCVMSCRSQAQASSSYKSLSLDPRH